MATALKSSFLFLPVRPVETGGVIGCLTPQSQPKRLDRAKGSNWPNRQTTVAKIWLKIIQIQRKDRGFAKTAKKRPRGDNGFTHSESREGFHPKRRR